MFSHWHLFNPDLVLPCSLAGTSSRQAIISRPRLACRTTSLPHSEHAGLAGVVSEPPRSVQNLTVQNYHTFVESNDSLVIVDYYTDWCGPCKMIAPELERMAAQYSKVAFAKLNCGLDNDSKRLVSQGVTTCVCLSRDHHDGPCAFWSTTCERLSCSIVHHACLNA